MYSLLDRFAAPFRKSAAGEVNFSSVAVIIGDVGKWWNNWVIACVRSLAGPTILCADSAFFFSKKLKNVFTQKNVLYLNIQTRESLKIE